LRSDFDRTVIAMRVPFAVPTLSRRELLETTGLGLGAVVLNYLLSECRRGIG
jgi:hypothetical protein